MVLHDAKNTNAFTIVIVIIGETLRPQDPMT